jgi:hypothetical protein
VYLAGANVAAQKYGPPLIGRADTISAILSAVTQLKSDMTIQLMIIVAGPPACKLYAKIVVILTGTLCNEAHLSETVIIRNFESYYDRERYAKIVNRA